MKADVYKDIVDVRQLICDECWEKNPGLVKLFKRRGRLRCSNKCGICKQDTMMLASNNIKRPKTESKRLCLNYISWTVNPGIRKMNSGNKVEFNGILTHIDVDRHDFETELGNLCEPDDKVKVTVELM